MKNKDKFLSWLSGLPIRIRILLSIVCVLFFVMATFISLTLNSNKMLVLQVSKSEIINFTHLSADALGFGLDTLNLEYVRNIVRRMKEEPRLSSLLILDNESNVIAGLKEGRLKGIPPLEILEQKEPVVKGENIYWASPIRGYDAHTLQEKILGHFIVEFSLKSVNAKILDEQVYFLIIAGCVLLVGVLISFLLARQISNPIAQLVDTSQQVGQTGDYRLRVEKKTGGEIGLLVDQYNEMLSQIQKQNEVMMNLNETLEQRVKSRTQDLQKAKEEAEQAREEAERANRAKTDFLSRVSHELRTPLNAILGFSQLLKIKGWQILPDSQQQNEKTVDSILDAGSHLLSLINEVLTLSQIETGEFGLDPEPIDMIPLVKEIKVNLLPLARQYNVQLNVREDVENPVVVQADPKRVRQILSNLVSNAIKYNRRGGQVEIWVDEVGKSEMTLKVRDTGMGIALEQSDAVFEPFERLDWEFSPVEGAGMGLSVSKALVEAMGGTLGLESELDKGSTFFFTLPLYLGEFIQEEPAEGVS